MDDHTKARLAPRAHVDLTVYTHSASALLAAGIPMSLIIDLAEPAGPRSHDVYVAEPADLAWLTPTG
jgi:hypothetical protein